MSIEAAGAGRDFWSVFSDLAGRLGGNDAILAPGRASLTFAGLAGRLAATKESLNRLGLGRGDRVAIALPNGPEMAVCLVSTIACSIAVPLNPSYAVDELRRYLARIRPQALVLPAAEETPARAIAEELGVRVIELAVVTTAPAGTFTLAGIPAAPCHDPVWNTADDTGAILLTSGTTSREKLVPLKLRHLSSDALGINAVLGLGPTDRSFLVMPLFHASGIYSSFLVPLINGAAVVCLRGFDIAAFFGHMDEYRPTWIPAGYAFLKAVHEGVPAHRGTVGRSRVRFIRSGTGGLDPEVKRGLEAAFAAPVIEQYSSTETGPMACTRLPPERGKPGTVGRPVYNEVAIMDSGGALLPTDQEGEIVVRGPSVFDGYLDDPETNAAAFTGGWFRTGDLGRLDGDGFLTITGRVKELINRGGEKISPQEVEAVIAGHGAVREVKVFGIAHPSLGEEVFAAVVLREGAAASEADLSAFVKARLAHFKVPRRIFFRLAFPLGATRKLDVRGLVRDCERLLEAGRAMRASSPGRTLSAAETAVRDLWREAFGDERIGLDENFFVIGGDSLRAVEILVALERKFGVDLPVSAMYGAASTVSGMAAEVDRLRAGLGQPGEARPPERRRPAPAVLRASDLLTLLTLAALVPAAWLLPFRVWSAVCNALARAHIMLRRARRRRLEDALSRLQVTLTAEELERRFLSDVYLDMLMTLREHLLLPWRPSIRLSGTEHIEAALAAGRGAVLWSFPSAAGGLISKKALKAAGVRVVNLRSADHPYSNTWFGKNLLNPVRTHVEDRYVAGTVVLENEASVVALHRLTAHLKANAIVALAANGVEGTTVDIPFLGGTLVLSLGAPTLAALHGVPLLPVFTAADGEGGFEVTIGPRIEPGSYAYAGETARHLARGYARVLEAHLRRHPAEWRGWFMRNTWIAPPGRLDPGIGRE